MKQYDIVIIGSGMVGASLALALSPYGFKIAIIDKLKYIAEPPPVLNARAIALSRLSVDILKTIKVWESLEKKMTEIKTLHVSFQGKFGISRIKALDLNLKNLGFVVDADVLNQSLNQGLLKIEIDQFRETIVTACTQTETGSILELQDGHVVQAKLLVAADGRDSYIRKHFAINCQEKAYNEQAIVANLGLNLSHQNIAFERFLNIGSLAFLPFGEKQVKSVLVVANDCAASLLNKKDQEYLAFLQTLFGFRLGKFVKLGNRSSYPLSSIKATSVYGRGFVLIGNAANTLHPIAAQGFNLGLRDVAFLVETLVKAKENNENIMQAKVLERYAQMRFKDHQNTHFLTEILQNQSIIKKTGILGCELSAQFKSWFLKRAMGYGVDLPQMCYSECN